MIKHGSPPYLECSSRGDSRFSAFFARPLSLGGKSIEDAYQAMKILDDGTTGLSWKASKGRRAVNHEECARAYEQWWEEYINERGLLPILKSASGLSDMFGTVNSVCQATVLWEIRNRCIVQFCRKSCPILPDNADVNRASGDAPCEKCNGALHDHPMVAYPSGMSHCHIDCDGRYWHL